MKLLLPLLLLATAQAKTCLMMYQMADNNLDFYLRQDYDEFTRSPVIKSDDLRTWVYYDSHNTETLPDLPNTVDANGQPAGPFLGSRYITYDASIGQMRVDVDFTQEMNSDSPDTIQNFLVHAMNDCMANNYTQLMAIFASHGAGFAGFGGDETVRGRHLLQTNQEVAASIRAALDAVVGTEERLEVLGFDACLMSAVGSTDDYHGVTKYLLASEAVEPGHGWSYSNLTNATTPLALARNIFDDFLESKQGRPDHQAPKTLSLVNTDRFIAFVSSFESLAVELLLQLQSGDVSLHTFISRARASAIAFAGVVDTIGAVMPSAMDIGSFLGHLETLCSPGGDLGGWLLSTRAAYEEMFVFTGTGPGTAAATGMHITWPNQGEYQANTVLWNQVLFSNGNYVTQIIPNFRAFVNWFLTSAVPADGDVLVGKTGQGSVCGMNATSSVVGAAPGALILSDSGVDNLQTGTFDIQAEIATQVSQMMVDYAVDLSTPLKPVLIAKGYVPNDEEYLYLLGGDVAGQYQGSNYTASWDKNFYFLNISGVGQYEALYVKDEGDGSRTIPAIYFPEDKRDEVAQLQFLDYLFFDFDFWVEQGARISFLKFSVDEAVGRVNDNLALFVSDANNGFAEMPREAGGMILPIIYIDAYIQGRKLDILPGGFNQTVIEWNLDLNYNVLTTPAENIFNVFPDTDAVMISVHAWNHGNAEAQPDVRYYDVIRKNRGTSIRPDGEEEAGTEEVAQEVEQEQPSTVENEAPETFADSGAPCLSLLVAIGLGLVSLLL